MPQDLPAIEAAFREAGQRRMRHLGLTHPSQLPRFQLLGVSGGGANASAAASRWSRPAPASSATGGSTRNGRRWTGAPCRSRRAIAAMIASSGCNDVLRIWHIAQRDGIDFNLACDPRDFTGTYTEPFGKAYMRALFDVGFDRARRGYDWAKQPPGGT